MAKSSYKLIDQLTLVTLIIHRLDDCEDKWIVVPKGLLFTDEDIEKQIFFQEQYFHHELIRTGENNNESI